MKNQTVIVTGASSDMGKEIARLFLNSGDNVVIHAQTGEQVKRLFHELGSGNNLAMVSGDSSDSVTGIKLLAAAVGKFGCADILVNHPSLLETRPFFRVDEAYFDHMVNTSLKAAFFTIQGILPQMIRQSNGAVVNIAGAGLVPVPAGAIHALTLQLAHEFGKHHIRFNTVTPVPSSALSDPGNLRQVNANAQMVYALAKSQFLTGTMVTS